MLQSMYLRSVPPGADSVKGGIEVRKLVELEFSVMGCRWGLCCDTRRPIGRVDSGHSHAWGWYRIVRLSLGRDENLERLLQLVDTRALRTLLSKNGFFVHSLSDLQVRVAVARHIVRGAYGLYEFVCEPLGMSSGPFERPATARVPASVPAPAPAPVPLTSTPAKARSGSLSRRPEPVEVIPELAVDQMNRIDQAAQAAVLVNAARHGVAFCEECAPREKKREALLTQ
ncbi:hypothetical protein ACSFBF_22685 [Variovorax sp. ZT5P49]|uniref:hypothetical protein n=1 Tax=Variovorax sp. ZT5P49 TaxID=3443733 RepID=UPI003F44C8E5